ncbi:MAG: amidohydrolase family protein [Proteobacteria bacterium]|nr:amidohydrolase family protein [Burkholderiales bacterium]
MMAPLCLPPDPSPSKPSVPLPPGTTDCHCHVFEDPARYPLIENRTYTPNGATLDDYVAMCEALGIERTVQVNASVYGNDNSTTIDVIAKLGQDRARGVAGLAADATDAQIGRLHDAGFRGVRLSTRVKGYGGLERLESMAARVKPFGWHLQVHFGASAEVAEHADRLRSIDAPIVFDHFARVGAGEGPNSESARALIRQLVERDDRWVKFSSFYKLSGDGPPAFADLAPLARAIVDARPDRVVWGSNWPHPNMFAPARVPNDGMLFDALAGWLPDPGIRQRVLVDNPARLYGFAASD